MDFSLVRPNKVLSALNELQKTKKVLTRFENNKNLENFLKNNESKHNNKNKIDLIINNFEQNTLFLYSNENAEELFNFLNKSNIEYSLSESLIYKMYLYFYGYVEKNKLESMLFRYSGNTLSNLDFKKFVEINIKNLFQKNNKFPRILNGEYKLLSELIDLIQENLKILNFLEPWEENLLIYLQDINREKLKIIYKEILKKIDLNISNFFKNNKKIIIKNINIEYKYIKDIYQKITKIKLEEGDILISFQKVGHKEKRSFYYLERDLKNISSFERTEKIQILNEYDLINVFKNNYSLSKIYLLKQKIKRILK